MDKASKPASLAEELAARQARDQAAIKSYRKAIEKSAKSELEIFGEQLQQSARDELQRRASAMRADLERVQWLSVWTWAQPVVIAAAVVIGVGLGAKTLIGVLSWDLQRLYESRRQVLAEIEQQREVRDQLTDEIWGVGLRYTENGRYVVFPEGKEPTCGWRLEGRPAARLAD